MSEEKFYFVYVADFAGRAVSEIHRGMHYRDGKPVRALARHAISEALAALTIAELVKLYPRG